VVGVNWHQARWSGQLADALGALVVNRLPNAQADVVAVHAFVLGNLSRGLTASEPVQIERGSQIIDGAVSFFHGATQYVGFAAG
jgi:hypothetical protein